MRDRASPTLHQIKFEFGGCPSAVANTLGVSRSRLYRAQKQLKYDNTKRL